MAAVSHAEQIKHITVRLRYLTGNHRFFKKDKLVVALVYCEGTYQVPKI